MRFYETWGGLLAQHQVPYRDFNIEYPPLALPTFVVPVYLRKLFGYHGTYFEWFRIQLLAIGLLTGVATAWALAALRPSRRRAYVAMCVAGAGPALLGPIALSRYDYWPTLFAAGAVAALAWRRPLLACGIAGAGAAAKVFPIVLVPLALIELWRRGRARAAAAGVAVAVLAVGAFVAPFAAVASSGLSWALHRQLVRPLQVESLGAAFFALEHVVTGASIHAVKGAGSDNLLGRGPDLASTLLAIATVVSLAAVYVLYARAGRTAGQLAAACAAAVVAYVAFSKVFSPQYLVWLIPLVPLVRGRAPTVLLVAAVGLTQVWEPYRYYDFVTSFSAWLTALLVVRDLLVVALFVVLLRSVRDAKELDPVCAPVVRALD